MAIPEKPLSMMKNHFPSAHWRKTMTRRGCAVISGRVAHKIDQWLWMPGRDDRA
jgi:hypothetical protein